MYMTRRRGGLSIVDSDPLYTSRTSVVPRPQTIIAEASGAESNEEYNQKAVEELRRRILSRGF